MAKEEHDALDAMASEFIAEIKDDLASLEIDLLAMEKMGAQADQDLIHHAFRSIHSIKGGAGFLNFQELSGLSHVMESVLMQIREKKLIITSEIVDALLSGLDKMKVMVEMMGKDESCTFSDEMDTLKTIITQARSGSQKESISENLPSRVQPVQKLSQENTDKGDAFIPVLDSSAPELENKVNVVPVGKGRHFTDKTFTIDKGRLQSALDSQKYVYAVCLLIQKDLVSKDRNIDTVTQEINSVGDVLYSDTSEEQNAETIFFIVATILDLPLLIQVLEIDSSQVSLVDKQFVDVETILRGFQTKPFSGENQDDEPANLLPEQEMPKPSGDDVFSAPAQESSRSMPSGTIRINVDLISRLMNRAGELVLARNQLRPILEKLAGEDKAASQMMQNLDMVTSDIQEAIMQMRMQPIIDLLGKYRRVVRDIARRISKKVELVIDGADVEVDRNVLEKLANPVTHLIRNCIDHGIETPAQRKQLSKPATGTIRIKAHHQGGYVHLSISDDGAGIDPQLILSKAFEKGLVTEEQIEQLTEKQKINLIFLPGFSTSETVTDISGRGVGMDVVKTNIERLRGQIEIESVKGQGTLVHMTIPLTLAIVPSLIVSTGREKFAIPQVNIKEVIYLEPGELHGRVESVGGSEVLRLREMLLPVLRLRNVLGIDTYVTEHSTGEQIVERRKAIADRRQKILDIDEQNRRGEKNDRRREAWDATYVIVLKIGRDFFGLCVDELHDIEEVVVEPLSEHVKHLRCFSGASVLGDGGVIMVLDVAGIAMVSSLRFDSIKTMEIESGTGNDHQTDSGEKRDLLVFCNDDQEFFALPLKHVSRLEPLSSPDIHHTGSLKYVEQEKMPVLLISLDELFPAGKCTVDDEQAFCIFPKFVKSKVGILASKIIDTIEINQTPAKDNISSKAILGKVFVDEMMIQILDHTTLGDLIEGYVAQAGGGA